MLTFARTGLSAAGEGASWENPLPPKRIEMHRSARKKRYFLWLIDVSVEVRSADGLDTKSDDRLLSHYYDKTRGAFQPSLFASGVMILLTIMTVDL
jgi:hypothetical protein